jgi:hypothetical protein
MVLTNGSNFVVLKNFDDVSGSQCDSKFILSGNVLLGTAVDGGTNRGGVVFGLTVLPQIMSDANFGVQSNFFGFGVTGISNQVVIVDACTDLISLNWLPLQTNILTGGESYFSDSRWTNYPGRFYRLRSP